MLESPRNAVFSHLRSEGDCYRTAIPLKFFDGEFVDAWLDENKVREGWMNPLGTWIGADPSPMVGALGAQWAAMSTDGGEIWVVVESDGRPEGRQFVTVTTPRGRHVWYVKELVSACADVEGVTPRPSIEVITTESPERAATANIAEHGTGCFTMGTHDFLMDRGEEWDAQIDDSGIHHGWLTDDGLWVGDDLVEVVRAFGGTWGAMSTEPPARGLREMWIVAESDGRPMAQQLIPWQTPKGRTVWHRWNTVTVVPCPSNGE